MDPNQEANDINDDEPQIYSPQTQSRRSIPSGNFNKLLYVTIIGILIVAIITLAIVLPLTLVNKKAVEEVISKCPDGTTTPRVSCLSHDEIEGKQNLQNLCKSRGCCWVPDSDSESPDCVFPYNLGYKNFKWREESFSKYWLDLVKLNSDTSSNRKEIANLEAKIEMQTDHRLHLKFYPRRNYKNKLQRWEVPSGIKNEIVFQPLYNIKLLNNPFSVVVTRNNTGQIVFDTSKSSLFFGDQFIQLTTTLSSPHLFGIGENGKKRFKHELRYKTWPLFASHNHPYSADEKPNLYSQFPVYLNIEPDGNSHVVAFYNSNPSEFYLTPFPSLTWRAVGGIFDIYIFMGPTPVEAIAQFQQAFGLPKLPPYWSLGLQIGSSNYGSLNGLRNFTKAFANSQMPFDSVFVDTEYMANNGMFTVNSNFYDFQGYVNELRLQHRATVMKLTPGILNNSFSYPYVEGAFNDKIWIMENFFSAPFVGKLLGRDVIYPDFTIERTADWWKDALQKYLIHNQTIIADGLFLDYLSPVNENPEIVCQNNKWNYPSYKIKSILGNYFNDTLCMDARHSISKHSNVHGVYSHYMIAATSRALEKIYTNRTFIMSRNAFVGTGQYGVKYLGDFKLDWDNLSRFAVSFIEMAMFGFSMAGGDVCRSNETDYDDQLCQHWIKVGAMSPFMRLNVDDITELRTDFLSPKFKPVLNSSLYLRYSLMPFFYTELYHASTFGSMAVRPLAFQFPTDMRSYDIDNQWLWGDSLMVAFPKTSAELTNTMVYFPDGIWYDYYTGFRRKTDGSYADVQIYWNTTILYVRGGSIMVVQECKPTAHESRNSFVDIIIALDENYTASGEFYFDDGFRRSSMKKENYHRLTHFIAYRTNKTKNEDNGVLEIKRKSGRFATKLSYRELIVYGLQAKPKRITINENSYPVDSSKTTWDDVAQVYRVNLQTEVVRRVLVDNEYLSFRWIGGYVPEYNQNTNKGNKN